MYMHMLKAIFIMLWLGFVDANNRIRALEFSKFCLETSEAKCGGSDVIINPIYQKNDEGNFLLDNNGLKIFDKNEEGEIKLQLCVEGAEPRCLLDPETNNIEVLTGDNQDSTSQDVAEKLRKRLKDSHRVRVKRFQDLEFCKGALSTLRYPLSDLAVYKSTLSKLKVKDIWYCYPDNYSPGWRGAKEFIERKVKYMYTNDGDYVSDDNKWAEIQTQTDATINNDDSIHRLYTTDRDHSMYTYNEASKTGIFTGTSWKKFKLTGKELNKAYFFTPCRKTDCLEDLYSFIIDDAKLHDDPALIFPYNLFDDDEIDEMQRRLKQNVTNLIIHVEGDGEVIGFSHLDGLDPVSYRIEKAILKKRTQMMKRLWFSEYQSYDVREQTCTEKWGDTGASYVSGVIPPGSGDMRAHCNKCPPYLRGQQSAVTTSADFCAFNQKGWFYDKKKPFNIDYRNTLRYSGSVWGDYDADGKPMQHEEDAEDDDRRHSGFSGHTNGDLSRTWEDDITPDCLACKPFMECRCWYWSGAQYEQNRKSNARSSLWYPSRTWTGNTYGIRYAEFSHWSEGEDWTKQAHYTGDALSAIYNVDRSRPMELNLDLVTMPMKDGFPDVGFALEIGNDYSRTTIATELENWRAAITHIGKWNSFRSHRGLMDILIESKEVLYGQGYAKEVKSQASYDKFARASRELCARGNAQTHPGWCEYITSDWSMASITPWVFDPTKVMVDYSIINFLMELDNRIEMALEGMLDDDVWKDMDLSIGSFYNRTRYREMQRLSDLINMNKITERAILTQIKSKKWVDKNKDTDRYENRFFWSFSDEQAEEKPRSYRAEAIYANEAISKGVEAGADESNYIECRKQSDNSLVSARPAVYKNAKDEEEFAVCKLKKGQHTADVWAPSNWNTAHPTRDGEHYNGYFGLSVPDGAFRHVVKNKGFWDIQNPDSGEYKVFNESKSVFKMKYRTIYESLYEYTYLHEICGYSEDKIKEERDSIPDGIDAPCQLKYKDGKMKPLHAKIDVTKDLPSKDLDSLDSDVESLWDYKYYNQFPTGDSTKGYIGKEKNLVKTFAHASYANHVAKDEFNIIMLESTSNVRIRIKY